jgi:hypothetical protein
LVVEPADDGCTTSISRDSKKFDQLFQRMYELGKKLGPEYAAMVDELGDIDPVSEVGQEIGLTLDALDNLCGG